MPHEEPASDATERLMIRPVTVELLDPRGDESFRDEGSPRPSPQRRPLRRQRMRTVVLLFLATCLSTFLLGMMPGSGNPLAIFFAKRALWPELLWNGWLYSGAVMSILLAHEMGHYLQTRRHGIRATLPYFIPFPISPFGTMGAVILQDGSRADRRMLFDIAVSGPLAGLVLALPITCLGIMGAEIQPVLPPDATGHGIAYGNPLILEWLVALIKRPMTAGEDISLNPLVFAGWVGLFITALNLMPIGQLDGGHILYTLIGRRAHAVAWLLLAGAVGFMVYSGYPAYALMVGLLVLMGPAHPPTANDHVPLGWGRIVLGWLTLAFVVVGFTPIPIVSL